MQEKVKEIIRVQKQVIQTVKLSPFFIAIFYMLTILGYMYMPDIVITFLDTFLYVSPLCVIIFLILSKQLGLCKWHKLECCLPVLCMLPSLFDWTIAPLSELASYINAILLSCILCLSLVNAYFVFIKPSIRR